MDGKGALFQSRGAVVVKARLGNDIRRIPIHNDDLTFNDLVLMLQRVFRDALQPSDELLIKYSDEDGDLVTLINETDLVHAKQQVRTLKLTLFVNGRDVRPLDSVMMDDIKRELQQVCTAVSGLLEKLDLVATRARADPISTTANVTAGGVLQPIPSPSRRTSSSDAGSDVQAPSQLSLQRPAGQVAAASGFDPVGGAGVGALHASSAAFGQATSTLPAAQPQPQQQQQHGGYTAAAATGTATGMGGSAATAVSAATRGAVAGGYQQQQPGAGGYGQNTTGYYTGGAAAPTAAATAVVAGQGYVAQGQQSGSGYAQQPQPRQQQQQQQQQQYQGYANSGGYAGSSAPNNF